MRRILLPLAFLLLPMQWSVPGLSGNGVPIIVAKADQTAQAANVGSTTLYAVPTNGSGFYRATCYVVVTQQATTSATGPRCLIAWTDNDTGVNSASQTLAALNQSWNDGGNPAIGSNNIAKAAVQQALGIFNVKASTTISYSTDSYASVGGTPMQYAVHVKLEYLGP